VQHADISGVDGRGVPTGVEPVAAGLEPEQLHLGVVDERGEQPDGVRPAADTRRGSVRQ